MSASPVAPERVDDEVVRSIVDQVWESLLGSPAVDWSGPPDRLRSATTVLTAEITLTGDWTGMVRLTCGPATARSLAATMLGAGPGEVLLDEDVEDAVGEVVNVVGGNVKGTLRGSTSLGLPRVAGGAGHGVGPHPGTTGLLLTWEGEPVLVEVVPDPDPPEQDTPAPAGHQDQPPTDGGRRWTS